MTARRAVPRAVLRDARRADIDGGPGAAAAVAQRILAFLPAEDEGVLRARRDELDVTGPRGIHHSAQQCHPCGWTDGVSPLTATGATDSGARVASGNYAGPGGGAPGPAATQSVDAGRGLA